MLSVDRFQSSLTSPLTGVPAHAWARFVSALDVQPIRSVSESGGFGSYDIRPRRLVELGYAKELRPARTPSGRQVYACDFIAPWTLDRFLSDPMAQYRAFARSTALYHKSLVTGQLAKPADMSMSGALSVLHIGGRGALGAWPNLFENTQAVYESARGAF